MSTTKVQSDMVDIDGATTATIATGDKRQLGERGHGAGHS